MDLSNLQFNNQTWVLILPLFLMAIDILTGYLTAWQSATVQSGKMRSGLVKKSGEIIEIIVIEVLGQAINLPQEVVQAISAYICLTEGVSIVENLHKMGVPIPKKITDHLYTELQKEGASE